MEELFPFLILLLFAVPTVLSIGKSQNKQNQKTQQQRQRPQQSAAAPAKSGAVLPPRPQTPARPTLQPTLHDHSGMYEGSLHADDGTEGSDPHDHGFDHEVDMPSEHSAEALNSSLLGAEKKAAPASGLKLDFTPRNIASAFVLQEVLKRRGA